jgi:hypothetical protein
MVPFDGGRPLIIWQVVAAMQTRSGTCHVILAWSLLSLMALTDAFLRLSPARYGAGVSVTICDGSRPRPRWTDANQRQTRIPESWKH